MTNRSTKVRGAGPDAPRWSDARPPARPTDRRDHRGRTPLRVARAAVGRIVCVSRDASVRVVAVARKLVELAARHQRDASVESAPTPSDAADDVASPSEGGPETDASPADGGTPLSDGSVPPRASDLPRASIRVVTEIARPQKESPPVMSTASIASRRGRFARRTHKPYFEVVFLLLAAPAVPSACGETVRSNSSARAEAGADASLRAEAGADASLRAETGVDASVHSDSAPDDRATVDAGGGCPALPPTEGAPCRSNETDPRRALEPICSYGAEPLLACRDIFFCRENEWARLAYPWCTEAHSCGSTSPHDGSACDEATWAGTCTVDDRTFCDCVTGTLSCITPEVGCPDIPPNLGESCSEEGKLCNYRGVTSLTFLACERAVLGCRRGRWVWEFDGFDAGSWSRWPMDFTCCTHGCGV